MGGGAIMRNAQTLQSLGSLIYLKTPLHTLWERISARGMPAYLDSQNYFIQLANQRILLYEKAGSIYHRYEWADGRGNSMASNSFGNIFRITTWGESHGKAIGVVIDGCPAGLKLDVEEINAALLLRAPGRTPFTSPRKEPDQAEILSGVFEGYTTGAPSRF